MWHGRSALACLLERIKSTGLMPVLCCADDPADEPLRAEAARENVEFVAGDPDHVLRRYGEAMSTLGVPAAIIVDGDDAFVSTGAMLRMMAAYDGQDLIECKGLPYGGAPYLLSRTFVDRINAMNVTPNGWSRFLKSVPGRKAVIEIQGFDSEDCGLRLSLDYEEDLAFLRYLYDHVPRHGTLQLEEVVAFIRSNRTALAVRFPTIFDGTVAQRAAMHLASEP